MAGSLQNMVVGIFLVVGVVLAGVLFYVGVAGSHGADFSANTTSFSEANQDFAELNNTVMQFAESQKTVLGNQTSTETNVGELLLGLPAGILDFVTANLQIIDMSNTMVGIFASRLATILHLPEWTQLWVQSIFYVVIMFAVAAAIWKWNP